MIPEYMRFYKYTVSDVLNEYARTFFSLVNSMFEIHAREMLDDITISTASNSKDGNTIVSELIKRQKGLGAVIEEVKIAKNARNT